MNAGSALGLSPSWFFDGRFYRSLNRDLTDESLRFGGFSDIYAHYLLQGIGEKRTGHWVTRALHLLTNNYDFPSTENELAEFLIKDEQVPAAFRPAFDYEWMKEKYSWGRSVRPINFIRYYLQNAKLQQLSPSPYFDEPFYVASYPEIKSAVDEGGFASGYEHFVLHGMNEGRRPFAGFDPHYYADINIAKERSVPRPVPFAHFLKNRSRGLPISPPLAELEVPENIGKALYERRCILNASALGNVTFTEPDVTPDVSIVIIARDNYEQTANCIVSAVFTTKAKLEVIIFDNASTDNTQNIPSINAGIKYIRADTNLGFTIAVNRASELATGRVLLLINNDLELTPGAIDASVTTLDKDETVGAVGAKVVRMHGRLQEGGSIIWRDGSCLGYGRDHDPAEGQVNFVRDVDFCSGCFLAIRRSEWQEMAGFDEAYAPAYYEETDFCVRLWERGKRVVYDPRVVVWHYEFGSSSIREEPLALMRRNQRYFVSKHRAFLAACPPPAPGYIESARLRHVARPRTLFIEDALPDPTKGMGYVRSAIVAQVLEQTCGLVSIMGLHDSRWPSTLPRDRDGRRVEILSNVNVGNMESFLRERVGVYDIVWLSRTHNLTRLRDWQSACPEFFAQTRIVLDTEAVAATRRFGYAKQTNQPANLAEMVLEEFGHLDGVDHICAVNKLDRDLLVEMLGKRGLNIPVSVLGSGPINQFERRGRL